MINETVNGLMEEIDKSVKTYKLSDSVLTGDLGLVAYVDGGYRAKMHYNHSDPACGGCGVFGYIYTDELTKVGHGCQGFTTTHLGIYYNDELNKDVETKRMGMLKPKAVTPLTYLYVRDGSEDFKSNNYSELMGMLHALRFAKAIDRVKTIYIRGDSKYVIDNLVDNCEKWATNGWKLASGDPVKNLELWQELYSLYQELQQLGKSVNMGWVKGHSDSIGNAKADQYATDGMNATTNGATLPNFRVIPPRDVWQPKPIDYPQLLSEPLMFVSNSKTNNTVTINDKDHYFYYQGNFGKEGDDYTKVGSDKSYAVTAMYNKEPVVQGVVELCRNIDSYNGLTTYIGRLDEFFKPRNYLEMVDVGLIFLRRNWKNQFNLTDGKMVIEELTPIRHGDRLTTVFNFLEEVLYNYIAGSLADNYVVQDITNDFYEVTEVKKGEALRVKPDIDKYLDVDIGVGTNLRLTIGIDTPKLRVIKHYASAATKIKLLYWKEGDQSLRYLTLIETIEGVGIWGSVYSNTMTYA